MPLRVDREIGQLSDSAKPAVEPRSGSKGGGGSLICVGWFFFHLMWFFFWAPFFCVFFFFFGFRGGAFLVFFFPVLEGGRVFSRGAAGRGAGGAGMVFGGLLRCWGLAWGFLGGSFLPLSGGSRGEREKKIAGWGGWGGGGRARGGGVSSSRIRGGERGGGNLGAFMIYREEGAGKGEAAERGAGGGGAY